MYDERGYLFFSFPFFFFFCLEQHEDENDDE